MRKIRDLYAVHGRRNQVLIYQKSSRIGYINDKNEMIYEVGANKDKYVKAFVQGQKILNKESSLCSDTKKDSNAFQKVDDEKSEIAGNITLEKVKVFGDYSLKEKSMTTYNHLKKFNGRCYSYSDYLFKVEDPNSEFYRNALDVHEIKTVLLKNYEILLEEKGIVHNLFSCSDLIKLHHKYLDENLTIVVEIRERSEE